VTIKPRTIQSSTIRPSTIKPLRHLTLYRDENYNTFPSAVALNEGGFISVFRQAPDRRQHYGISHIDPASKAVAVFSRDGTDWETKPSIVYDDFFYGVQDPCLNKLADGSLLATFFMWKVAEQEDAADQPGYSHKVFDRWLGKAKGAYTIRSADGGGTWDKPVPIGIPGAIRGNCAQLADGSVIAPLYGSIDGLYGVKLVKTSDKGETWSELAVVPGYRGPEGEYAFVEPTLFRTDSGRLMLFIRSRKRGIAKEEEHLASPLFTVESEDDGLTWSTPAIRRIYTPSPFHLLRLASGDVVLSYGYRLAPHGIRAVLLDTECRNLDDAEAVVLRDDGAGFDIGYTTAIELADGKVLIIYYYSDGLRSLRYIAGTLCEIG
jgi:hypothetical protein